LAKTKAVGCYLAQTRSINRPEKPVLEVLLAAGLLSAVFGAAVYQFGINDVFSFFS
jgi:hypothetical protein